MHTGPQHDFVSPWTRIVYHTGGRISSPICLPAPSIVPLRTTEDPARALQEHATDCTDSTDGIRSGSRVQTRDPATKTANRSSVLGFRFSDVSACRHSRRGKRESRSDKGRVSRASAKGLGFPHGRAERAWDSPPCPLSFLCVLCDEVFGFRFCAHSPIHPFALGLRARSRLTPGTDEPRLDSDSTVSTCNADCTSKGEPRAWRK